MGENLATLATSKIETRPNITSAENSNTGRTVKMVAADRKTVRDQIFTKYYIRVAAIDGGNKRSVLAEMKSHTLSIE